MDKLDKHIDGIELTLKVGDISEPILYIGFNIPEEVNFSDREFRHPIYFARAVFHKKAIFKGVKFCEIASFHYAKFYEQAIFRNTIFKQEANFSNVHFKSNVKFIGTPAAPKNGDISLDLYTNFEGFANFFRTEFDKQVSFSGAKFNKFNGKNSGANFTHINFKGEVDFDSSAYYFSIFPSPSKSYDQLRTEQDAPIKFDDTTFRERARFIGETRHPLELGLVSFKGVDLTNVVFQNVKWLKIGSVWKRNAIVDELLKKLQLVNYEEISGVYNQLRKNYESRLYFDDASDFYIGDMETIRRKLSKSKNYRDKFKSGIYTIYKLLNQYGESTFVPLLVWTPVIITIFALLRSYDGCFQLQHMRECDIVQDFVDSLFAYFQLPREHGYDDFLDNIERIVSAPILAIAIKSFALTKRFETAIR